MSAVPVPAATLIPPDRRKGAPRALKRLRAYTLVVAIARELEREGIRPRAALVFKIARAAGAPPFRRAAGLRWIDDRPGGPRKLTPRTERERSRRLLIAVFKAIERVDGNGRGIVARAKSAARVKGGATFRNCQASVWLHRFKKPRADPRTVNLRQYRPLLLALRHSKGTDV